MDISKKKLIPDDDFMVIETPQGIARLPKSGFAEGDPFELEGKMVKVFTWKGL